MLTEDEEREFRQSKGNIAEVVRSLKYYCCDNEGEELFHCTLGLAYQMYGLGEDDKAWILVEWATVMASESFKEAQSSGRDDWEIDWSGHHWASW